MENYIRKVEIKGLFEKGNDYVIDLTEGCNCIYGSNGTGKTTIINIIVNCLNVETSPLAKIQFESVTIYLAKTKQKRATRFLKVKKIQSATTGLFGEVDIEFLIEGFQPTKFTENNRAINESRIEKSLHEAEYIKKIISKNINLTHIPLLRMHDADAIRSFDSQDDFLISALRHKKLSQSNIQEIMDPSVRVLSSLQSQFMLEANEHRKTINTKLEKLKSQIIEKVLIDEILISDVKNSFGALKPTNNEYSSTNPDDYITRLKDANISVPESKIQEHFDIWQRLNKNLLEYRKEMNKFRKEKENNKENNKEKEAELIKNFNESFFALFVATHFNDRLSSIVRDVEKMQQEKSTLTNSFKEYEKEINGYIRPRKNFSINEDGKFLIFSGTRRIEPSDLSSGEKHILTILGRAALNNKQGAVFVADEPELSLHLDWQRMILPSIMKLSPLSQIIVATHSPAIFPMEAHEIDLEECIKNAVN